MPNPVNLKDLQGEPSDEAPDQDPLMVETAFVVYKNAEGHWVADGNRLNTPINVARQATTVDFGHATADIERDLDANAAAQTFMFLMQQQAMAAQQAAKDQQLLNGLKIPGMPPR